MRLLHFACRQIPKRHLTAFVLLLSPAFLFAQVKTVRGTVTDETGKPVSGASILVKNSATGTSTNDAGKFSISASANDVLIVSAVNYESTELTVGNQTAVSVSLKGKTGTMNDVVVVGYATQKKANLTGAVTSVSGKELEDRPITNALAGLQGLAPGVVVTRSNGQPGSEGYTFQIRGYSSVNGSSPLVLIDGAPGTISTVNPNDIESISVLKDAAAAAIYGARAAGGVVLVTTKKGKSGKISVNYSGLYSSLSPINRPGRLHSWQEAQMANEARINAGQAPAYSAIDINRMQDPDTNYVVNPSNPNDYIYYYDLNQIPLIMKDRTSQWNHNLSVSGGGTKDNFFFSVGYFNQEGVFKLGPDKSDRINTRFNYRNQLSNVFSLEAGMAYRQTNTLSPSIGTARIFSDLYTTRTLYPTFFPGTTDKYINDNSGNFAYAFLKDGGANDYRGDELSGQVSLKAKNIVDGLSLTGTYSPRMVLDQNNIVFRTIPRYTIAGIGSYLNNPNTYQKQMNRQLSNNVQFLADYNKSIGTDHNFHLLVGYAYEDQRNDNTFAQAKKLSSNDFFTLNIGDPTQASNSESINTWGLESYFSRFNYAFKNRYLLEADLRYDGSSKLAPVNRWHAFPAVSAGWRLSQENWFSNLLPVFNEFKIRGSWGRLGNSDGVIGNYDYISLMSGGITYPFNNVKNSSYYQAVLASNQKSWETVQTSDIGLDLALLKNRLTFTGDYYIKKNIDMLAPIQLSSIIGISTSTYNIGELKTWGWETAIGWKDNIGKGFSYWINANLSDDRNIVTKYNSASTIGSGVNGIIEGYPINTLFGYLADGYYKDAADAAASPKINSKAGPGDIKYVDVNKDGKINAGLGRVSDHGDLVELGNTSPRYNYAFNFGFNWKGFDFSAFFQGVGQRKLFLNAATLVPYTSSWIMPMDYNSDYWTPTHQDAKFPRQYLGGDQNTANSTHWIMNGAYLRLKNIQVGYNLPASVLSRAHISTAKLYVSGQDLWTRSKMWVNAFDPEEPYGATWQYPFFKTISLGLNVGF